MGEWSKAVGEFGEKAVENFLNVIGWDSPPKGIEFKCLNSANHSDTGERNTHGLDFYFPYKSPLVDGVLKCVHVSVKYTSKKYPSSPTSDFKKHYEDLVNTIECFRSSQEKRDINDNFNGISSREDVGVLFWLSNDPESYKDLIAKIAGSQLSANDKFHSLFVVDNKRIEFIYQALQFAQSYCRTANVDVYYPNTGKNIIPTTKQSYGKMLPVEYINASILPLRIEEIGNNNCQLMLFTIDPFNLLDLKRLIGLSLELSGSWTTGIVIAFPDYNELENQMEVRSAKLSFQNRQTMERLKVVSYYDGFKSI